MLLPYTSMSQYVRLTGISNREPLTTKESQLQLRKFRESFPHLIKSYTAGVTTMENKTASTSTTEVNKFHKITLLTKSINDSINLSKLVDTATLTVAESHTSVEQQFDANLPSVSHLFQGGMLSEKEQEHLDRELVYMVQNLMASKIEAAVTELECMGVVLEDRLYSEYTQAPEDRL